jgi:UDP-glucose 4-epimerase
MAASSRSLGPPKRCISRDAYGRPIPFEIVARRPGDIATCYADPALAREEFQWQAELGIDAMVQDTWRWQSENPDGYR